MHSQSNSANDGKDVAPPAPSAETLAKREAFERVHRDWLAARAAMADPDQPSDEESMDARLRRHAEAERALMLLPAPLPWCVWVKFDLLENVIGAEAIDGERSDRFAIVAIGALKADLARLGIGEGE